LCTDAARPGRHRHVRNAAAGKACAIVSPENCGFRREPAKRRTSASVVMPASCSIATNTSHGRVECPIVQSVPVRSIVLSIARSCHAPRMRAVSEIALTARD
jgi:hypothetical protein